MQPGAIPITIEEAKGKPKPSIRPEQIQMLEQEKNQLRPSSNEAGSEVTIYIEDGPTSTEVTHSEISTNDQPRVEIQSAQLDTTVIPRPTQLASNPGAETTPSDHEPVEQEEADKKEATEEEEEKEEKDIPVSPTPDVTTQLQQASSSSSKQQPTRGNNRRRGRGKRRMRKQGTRSRLTNR